MQRTNTALREEPSSGESPLAVNQPPPGPLTAPHIGDPDDNSLVPVGGGSGIPFNGKQIKTAMANLPEDERDAITWLYQLGREKRWDLKALAGKLRHESGKGTYSYHVLYNVFRGKYGGALTNIVAAIKVFRAAHEARERINRPTFIETGLTKHLWAACDRARAFNRVAPIYGDGQIGKTEGLKEYQRVHNSTTRYLRLPKAAQVRSVARLLAKACDIPTHASNAALEQEIIEFFSPDMLLIVDELQQIKLGRSAYDRLLTVEFLREIFDRSGCGVVLCGTNEAMREMETGENAEWLRQLRRRSLPKMTLPNVADDEDILVFAAHFGLGPDMPGKAVEEVHRIAKDDGLGLLITYFQGAARMAATLDRTVDWDHFLRTVEAFAEQGAVRR